MPNACLERLLSRHSVAVKRMGDPGPSEEEFQSILEAATNAPDHGALRPWRLAVIAGQAREQLAELFVATKRRERADLAEAEIAREREKAFRPPRLIAFVARPRVANPKVTTEEQLACAGAAMQNILLAAHFLGYGAIVLSGSRCADPAVRASLGIEPAEVFLGFVSIGSIIEEPRYASRPGIDEVVSRIDAIEPRRSSAFV